MRRSLLISLCLVLIPFALTAVPKEKLEFSATSHPRNQKTIETGIETAIDDMSFITRPIARKKLKKTNLAFKKLKIDFSGSKVSITHDSRKAVVSQADGKKTKWKREDGEVFTVSQKVDEDKITQKFIADAGTKTLVYKFNSDFSAVTVNVRLDSPKLPAPLKYRLIYKK